MLQVASIAIWRRSKKTAGKNYTFDKRLSLGAESNVRTISSRMHFGGVLIFKETFFSEKYRNFLYFSAAFWRVCAS
jgi:hypothetical protein